MAPGEKSADSRVSDEESVGNLSSSESWMPDDSHIHILYVDDDPDMAHFFQLYLEKTTKFKIHTSRNGKEAIIICQ
jgi:response regulator RpfG family c-di-GMP phosphodiesterase